MTIGGRHLRRALAVLALALALPVVASAQEPPPTPEGPPACEEPCHKPDARIRRRTSNVWVGDGIYNIDSLGQTRVAVIPRRAYARFVVRFDNDGTDLDTFVVHGGPETRHFRVRYLLNGTNVTPAVRAGTQRFLNVPPGGFRLLTVEVFSRASAPVGSKVVTRVSVRSADEAGLLDRVKAVVYRSQGRETRIEGRTYTNLATAQRWARNNGASPRFVQNAALYFELAPPRGIRPEVAYAQSAKETAYGNFGGVLTPAWRNSCGLKTTEGGSNDDPNAHQRFRTWRLGVIACIDHLALYAGAPGYPRANTPDPRHFPSIYAVAPTVERLGGRWAPAGDYGTSIVKDFLNPLLGS